MINSSEEPRMIVRESFPPGAGLKGCCRKDKWIMCSKSRPEAKLRLFCFPYAGGGASAYHGWSEGLPHWVEVLAIQPPGRENRIHEMALTGVRKLVVETKLALLPLLDKPFAFFGHSMGALTCFELARQLRNDALPLPELMMVSASGAPHALDFHSTTWNLPEDKFICRMRGYGGIPQAVLDDVELKDLVLPKLRADIRLMESYVYAEETPLRFPLAGFVGDSDPVITRRKMEGWSRHTSNLFNLYTVAGNHFFLHSSRRELLRQVTRCLDSLF